MSKYNFTPSPYQAVQYFAKYRTILENLVRLFCTSNNIRPEKYHGCNLYNLNNKFVYNISPEMEPTRAPPRKVEIGPFTP